jgi:hypothetical protein
MNANNVSGTANQGYAGGQGISTSPYNGGGGGGAGAVGANRSGSVSGNGGAGISCDISGSSLFYGGGGGGGGQAGTAGTGGSSIGGNGSITASTTGTSGTTNRGAGGGGGGSTSGVANSSGGAGGSGVVIISYPEANGNVVIPSTLFYKNSSGALTQGTGVAVNPTLISNGKKIYEFLQGSGNIQFT